MNTKVKRPAGAFIGLLAGGFGVYFLMRLIQPYLPEILFGYDTWDAKRGESIFYRVLWLIGDGTEPQFAKSAVGGAMLIAGGWLAYFLDRRKSRFRGTPVAYGTGTLYPWIFLGTMVSLAVGGILFGGMHPKGDTWVATFVPYVSASGAVVLLYGAGFSVAVTGGILNALIALPVTTFLRLNVCRPLGISGTVANVGGMCIGGIFVFEICRALPWMKRSNPRETTPSQPIEGELPMNEYKRKYTARFFFRRILCDYSEPVFLANEWAAVFMAAGCIISWLLNPKHPFYGTGLFPELLLGQVICCGVSMYLWWDQWMERDGGYATFLAAVSVGPACIQVFGGSLIAVILAAVLGAAICPPMADMVNRKIPPHWHPMVGNTFAMAAGTWLVNIMMEFIRIGIPGIY